jgi:hypothetical protein
MSDDHKVNEEKLKRFLTELILTHGWSDEFDKLEPWGKPYWQHIRNLGIIKNIDHPVYLCEITSAGRKWLDSINKGELNEQ